MSCSEVSIVMGERDNLGGRKGGWREAGQGHLQRGQDNERGIGLHLL